MSFLFPLFAATLPTLLVLQALQSASGKHKAVLSPERAYCLFRLARLEEALEVARGGAGSVEGSKRVRALRHLEAQVRAGGWMAIHRVCWGESYLATFSDAAACWEEKITGREKRVCSVLFALVVSRNAQLSPSDRAASAQLHPVSTFG